jgi:NitT/TauT family transport system substrate-binding protein
MIVAPNRIMDRETYVGVLEETDIHRYRDLSGKTVGTNVIKGISPLFISELVWRDRGDPDTIRWVELPFPNMIAALLNKQVVGALLVEPFATVAKENPKIRLLSPYFGLLNYGGPLANWVATDKWIGGNRALLGRFVRAHKKAVDYSNAHPDEARLIVTKYTRIKPPMAKKMGLPNWSNKIDLANLQWIADLVHKHGYIDKRFDVSGLLHELAR